MTLMTKLRPRRGEHGFTLMEMMAALLVFSIVTLGLVPLLASSIKGSTLSRSYTIGKNAAVEGMERIRGLPFFVSYATRNSRVDVLDLYFPNLGPGYSANTFTTTCTTGGANPACPTNIPEGMTITYKATFVRTSTYSAVPERYDVITPPAGYRWDSATGADIPPSQLLELLVRGSWDVGGENKVYELKTLIGDKKVGTMRLRGTGRVDYGAQILTSYDVGGLKSDLIFTGASTESKVETKLLSTANQTSTAGVIRLLRASDDPSVLGTDLGASPRMGATSSLFAPPDTTPGGASVGAGTLSHPEWGPGAAYLDGTSTSGLKAVVANELPAAGGETKTTTVSGLTAWVHNQAATGSRSLLQMENGEKMIEIARTTRALQAESFATTTATTAADRKVETVADTKLGDVRVLPVRFIGGSDDHIVRIGDFRASATCKATGNAATAAASGTWSATLRYWKDTVPGDDNDSGSYQTVLLNSATLGTTMETIQSDNPLVLDQDGTVDDVYLFETATKLGYLTDWGVSAPTATTSADGRVANVNIDGAIRIDTAYTNPANPATAMSVSLGKLSCEAVDNR